jgi:Tfp pilus assembly protein PilF
LTAPRGRASVATRASAAGVVAIGAAMLIVGQLPGLRAQDTRAREQAYRLNNVGVARLEQYDYRTAAETFRQALANRSAPPFARLNLAIALFYDNQLEDAEREARAAAAAQPNAPQPPYVLGLIARAAGRSSDAVEQLRRVLAIDPNDAGAKIQLGQVLTADRQFTEAIALLEQAAKSEPFNATAAYGLAIALTRAGRADEGRTAMARFQQLRDNPAAITYATTYLAQGRYAEAIVSTGLEAELVDTKTPDTGFTDVTDAVLGRDSAREALTISLAMGMPPLPFGVTLADVDGDGDLDLLFVTSDAIAIRKNDRGRFAAPTLVAAPRSMLFGVVAGDYDNDGRVDLFAPGMAACRLFHQDEDGSFRDVTQAAGLGAAGGARAAAFVDVDHDGDLDVVIGAPGGGGARLFRNNRNGRFSDATSEARLSVAAPPGRPDGRPPQASGAVRPPDADVVALVPTDFDNDRDIDLLALSGGRAPLLMSNLRDGTFGDVAAAVGMPAAARYAAAAAADINKDGATDFFFGRLGAPGLLVTSDRAGRFTTQPMPDSTHDAAAAQFVDYDNDGLLDLVVAAGDRLHVFRNLGGTWADVSERALRDVPNVPEWHRPVALAVGDLDGDGDDDLVVRMELGKIRVLRNDGGSRHPALRVALAARVSNRSALGAKVEMAAGSLRQKLEVSSATPAVAPADLVFGLGSRDRADVVRVLWPAGILQSEVDLPAVTAGAASGASIPIRELDRKPSSCPFLFTWNGSRFEFVTDFMGGGEMGSWLGPGERSVPDPEEYVRIPRGALVPRAGRLELRVTNELEEALFVDRLQLVAVAHPSGVDVFPAAGLRSPGERRPFALHTVRAPHPPLGAADDRGRDVLDRIVALDRRAVDGFELAPIQGYAREHTLTLDLGDVPRDARVQLLLTGWTDYAFSSDNVAAHQAGLAFVPPMLQMRDAHGRWQTIVPEIGLPTGRPQTIVLDLTDRIRDANARLKPSRSTKGTEVRIVTTARVYWDQILVDTSAAAPYETIALDPIGATLSSRGFSAEVAGSGVALPTYDYARVSSTAPWKTMPGRYTRFGDVRSLLRVSDDQFVVSAPGDEIALAFDASRLPALGAGWQWTFLLNADGFSKEMNLHSSSPDRLEPLPFHGMSRYPYSFPEHYPRTADHDRYRTIFNTRVVGGPLASLEQALLSR